MKKIRKILAISVWLVAIGLLACACSDNLDIRQDYVFDLETMPVPKKVKEGETVEIRCQLIREGNYQDTKFYIRMFQPDGVGQLKMDDGRILQPNDLYPLTKEVFRLYYTSLSSDQSVIDVYIEDSFGQVVQKTFSFQNENDKELNE
jgi:hypothetical protein